MIDPDDEIRHKRETAVKETKEALGKKNEDLVEEMFYLSTDRLFHPDPQTRISKTIAYFSSLLVNLSRQAEESTNKTIKLTKQICYLTWFIAILTAVILLVSFFEFPKKSIIPDLNPSQKTEQPTKNNDNK